MAQDIINIGPQPNDGQGDNLRTAFDKTNDNFDQIWTAGPVGSNVRIAGNTISTLQVNQDLALSPNGTGNVRLNNNTIPGANNTWFLGSATNQWRGVYANTVTAGNVTISSNLEVPGDVTIGGNLTVEGDTIQIGNIVTDTKTIQLSNTATTTAAANGSGITVGANDNIATFLYNSTTNSWVTNLSVTYANGQPIGQLPGGANTQIQFNNSGTFGGNANFTYNRATGNLGLSGANIFTTSGNTQPYAISVPGIAFQGGNAKMEYDPVNGHIDVSDSFSIAGQLELLPNSLSNGATIKTPGGSGIDITIEPSGNLYLNADGGEVIVSDQTPSVDSSSGALLVLGGVGVNGNINAGGNITAGYFIGNGSLLTGVSSYANANAVAYGQAGWAGNIIPAASNTYSLGNATNQWSDLYVSNATIYMNNVPIGLTAGNVLTVDGEPVLVNDSNTSITTTGNITADTFFGSGITAAAADDIVSLNAFDAGGNTVSIQAQGNTAAAVIESYSVAGNNRFTWSFDNTGTLNFPASQTSIFGGYDNDFTINTSNTGNATYTFTFSQFGDFSVPINLYVSGNVYTNDIVADAGNLAITANTQSWLFDDNGVVTLPGNSAINSLANTIRISASTDDLTGIYLVNDGDAEMYANANVSIYADSANSGQGWIFDTTGNLNLPNNGSIIVDDDGVIGPDGDDLVISWDNEELILRSVAGSVELQADNDVSITTSYGAGDFQWIFGNNNELVNITGDSAIVTEAGNLAISGGRDGLSSGNVTVRAVDVGVAVRDWTFDNNGDLTVPNYIYFKDGSFIGDEGGALPPVFRVDAPLGLGIDLTTDSNISGNNYTWSFGIDGNLTAPGDITTTGNITAGNFVGSGSNVDIVAGTYDWTFDTAGNLTLPGNTFAVNYANGTAVSLGGNYGDANVVTLLGSFGSNTVVTTGNITGGNLIATANVLANGYARLTGTFDESQASTAGLYLGYAGGTPRIMFGTGNTSQTLEIDNDGGTLRFYKPGTTLASLTNSGVFTAAGNIATGGQIQSTAFTGGNISWSTNNQIDFQGAIKVGGTGRILSPGGAASIETNNNGANIPQLRVTSAIAAANTTSGGLIVTGGAGIAGNVYIGGIANVTGNVNGSGATFSGNVTAANFSGNISITGNVTGTSPNVTLVAGSFSTVFDNTGVATFPGNVSVTGNVITPNLPAFRVYGTLSTDIAANTTITATQGATVDYNQGNNYNNTTGIFTAPVAGIYSCAATLRVGSTSGLNQASIQKNSNGSGANVVAFWEATGNSTTPGFGHFSMAGMTKLAVGDTVRLQVVAGNVNFDSNDSYSVTFLG